ncbi:MAG: regulatory protein RecX [Ignavibacteriaceae bacterium]
MRIDKVVKKGKNDVTVYLDNDKVIFLNVEVFLKNGLKKGDEISDDHFSFLIEQNKLFHIKQKAFRLLGRRQHSSSELRRKLWDRDYEQKLIDEVLNDLTKNGYIDDTEFIRAFMDEKSRTKNWSRKRIKSELIKRGLNQSLIDKISREQTDESDNDNAIRVAKKKFEVFTKRNLEPKELRNKLSTYLFSKGFDYDLIKTVVDKLLKE